MPLSVLAKAQGAGIVIEKKMTSAINPGGVKSTMGN